MVTCVSSIVARVVSMLPPFRVSGRVVDGGYVTCAAYLDEKLSVFRGGIMARLPLRISDIVI